MAVAPQQVYGEAARFVTHYSSVRTALVASSIALGVGVFGRPLIQNLLEGDGQSAAVNYGFGTVVLGVGVWLNEKFFRFTRTSMRIMTAIEKGEITAESGEEGYLDLCRVYAGEKRAQDDPTPPARWVPAGFFAVFAIIGLAGVLRAHGAQGDVARPLPLVMAEGEVGAASTVTVFHNATSDPIRVRMRFFCHAEGTTYHTVDITGRAGSGEDVSQGSSLHAIQLPAGYSLEVTSTAGCSWQLLQ